MFTDNRVRLLGDISDIFVNILDNFRLIRRMSSSPKEQNWEFLGKGILNLVYSRNLVRLEKIQHNFPAVDLGDYENGICVQVTVSETRDKINTTIKKFKENQLYDKFNYLKFFLIASDMPNFKKPFNVQGPYSFSKEDDIITFSRLIENIQDKEIEEMKNIKSFLETCYGLGNDEKYEAQRKIIEDQEHELSEKTRLIEELRNQKNQNESETMGKILIYENKDGMLF